MESGEPVMFSNDERQQIASEFVQLTKSMSEQLGLELDALSMAVATIYANFKNEVFADPMVCRLMNYLDISPVNFFTQTFKSTLTDMQGWFDLAKSKPIPAEDDPADGS
jgi:hypothetical protein